MTDALQQLSEHGVSIWLDDLSRERLRTGDLVSLVRERHVVGVTTNPTIFAAALAKGDAYDEQLASLAERGVGVEDAVFAITTDDVRAACDVLLPVYEGTGRLDGRVSIEVDPRLARNTRRTVEMARALWGAVDRPNVLIKIPATVEGLPAITQALSEGISVNVTLIFSLERYRAVMNAFLAGLEAARSDGRELSGIASVASFFVSRVDTEVDRRLDDVDGAPPELRGKAGIANARLAYHAFEEVFGTSRWEVLAAAGARPQRPLWASTGVKDPAYPDTMYVSELVAPGTVNTMPQATLDAVADHGRIEGDTVRGRYGEATQLLDRLESLGIGYGDVTDTLEREGVEKFEKSWRELLATVSDEMARAAGTDSPAEAGQ
jgi:transaldolase